MGIGDLTKYLNESGQITDYSWLDVKKEDYDNVPFNPIPEYVAVPKLEEAWKHQNDTNINLVPNVDLDYNYNPKQPSQEDIVTPFINFIKRKMMAGFKGKDLAKIIYDNSSPELRKASSEHLRKVAKEQGLLGNYYIDPAVFTKCTEGSKLLGKKAKTARYVKTMSRCQGCVHNDSGNCQIYKKKLSSEIPYDSKDLQMYSDYFSNKFGEKVRIASKKDLQENFLRELPNKVKVAEFLPIEKQSEVTLDDKKKEFENAISELKKDLANFNSSKVAADLSEKLILGYKGKSYKDYVNYKYTKVDINEYKDIFNRISSQQGSLGKVYIDASYLPFNNCKEAKKFFHKIKYNPAKFLVIPKGKPFCHCMNPSHCNSLEKNIVDDIKHIPNNVWDEAFNEYPKDIVRKIQPIFDTDKVKGLRLAAIQMDLVNYNPVNNSDYEITKKANAVIHEEANPIKVNHSISPSKIAWAIRKGLTLKTIIVAGKKIAGENIIPKVEAALKNIDTIRAYQIDCSITVPENVSIVKSDKEISNNTVARVETSEAPTENIINSYEIKSNELTIEPIKIKESPIVEGLSEFVID